MSIRAIATLAVLALLDLCIPPSAAEARAPDWSVLRHTIQAEMAANHIPGAAIAVVSRDRTLLIEGFGVAEKRAGRLVTPATCFRIGSLAKTFTGLALAGLAARGEIDLDRSVGSYLPNLPGRLPAPTLAQLLSHNAGLIDRIDRNGAPNEPTAAGFLAAFRPNDTFTAPGAIFSYSSIAYALAGRAAATTQGLSFADLMRREIFVPAGMPSANYDSPGACPDQATGYVHEGGRYRPADVILTAILRPAGLISANATDLARFARLLLGRGELDGRRIVPAEAVATISAPRVPIPGEGRFYGYGLFVADRGGRRILSHSGDELGTSSSLTVLPEADVAVLVLSNAPGRLPRTVETALRLVTGETIATGLPDPGPPQPLTQDDLERLPGDFGRFVISRSGDQLTIAPKIPFPFNLSGMGRRVVGYGGDNYGFIPEQEGRPPTRFSAVRGGDGATYLFLRGRAFRQRQRQR